MSSQIVFLFDLDQCLPLEQGLDSDDLEFLVAKVKDVCLKILTTSSHINGPNGETQSLAHFSFRFYSSTEYFMVPDQLDVKFHELADESFDFLETALSERFEALLQTSKTNSFNSAALHQHILQQSGHKAQFLTLQKALEEVSILYNWDRPLMHSPVKLKGKATALNAIYTFTKLPNSQDEMNSFMGKPKSKRRFNHKDIFDRVFNAQNRAMINLLKGDAQINVNIVDTASFRSMKDDSCADFVSVKNEFKKCLFQFHGDVLLIESFRSTKKCQVTFESPHPTSSILNAYMGQPDKKSYLISLVLNDQPVQLNCSENLNDGELRIQNFLRNDLKFINGLDFDQEVLLWPSQKSFSPISHFMTTNSLIAHVNFAENKSALIYALEDTLFQLKILSKQMTKLFLLYSQDFAKTIVSSNFKISSFYKEKALFPPRKKTPTGPLTYFKGCMLQPSTIPESSPFQSIIDKMKKTHNNEESEMMLTLKKSYLPHHLMMRRKTSEESLSSVKSSSGSGNQPSEKAKGRSRGAELLRLGSKNAELRRNSHEDSSKETLSRCSSNVQKMVDDAKDQFKAKFEAHFNEEVRQAGDSQTILSKLVDLQLEMLDHGENPALVAFAELVISKILHYVKKTKSSTLEDMVMTNFLIDPSVVTKRKSIKAVRIRDHKLQVLLRIELHWLLAKQDDQKKIEEEMLVHLRQISIWDSPTEMLTFLQEVITTYYINRQPELLCFLYEELNQPPPPGLSALFSPFKRSEASMSPDPASIKSIASDMSYLSNPSSWRVKGNSQEEFMPKVRRPQNFENRKLQIDLRDKKKGVVNPKAKVTKAKTPKRRSNQSKKTPLKKPPTQGVRRNLSFEDSSKISPRKKMKSSSSAVTPKKGSKTPKKTPKKNNHSKTPCKMTPGKRHEILVPETPTGKNGRRKSDGTQVVNESPNIDLLKQEGTSRALSASILVRNRTSFYSGELSRSVVAAEERMNAKHIQNFNNSLPMKLADSAGGDPSRVLFPFIANRQRRRSASRSSATEAVTPQKEVDKPEEKPEMRRSMRRLFEDADDAEISIKSPFKKPSSSRTLFSPAKTPTQDRTPRKRRPSGSSRASKTLFSPEKELPLKSSFDVEVNEDEKKVEKVESQASSSRSCRRRLQDDSDDVKSRTPRKQRISESNRNQKTSPVKSISEYIESLSESHVVGSKNDSKRGGKNSERRSNPRSCKRKLQDDSDDLKLLSSPVKSAQIEETGSKNEAVFFLKTPKKSPSPRKSSCADENELKSPEASNRPFRRKKVVEKLGIDDVESIFTPEKMNKNELFDQLVADNSTAKPDDSIMVTPTSKTYSRRPAGSSKKVDTDAKDIKTPDSSRPCRRKKFVERMGIDDVKLSEVVSPRVCITPFTKHSKNAELAEDTNDKTEEEEEDLAKSFTVLEDIEIPKERKTRRTASIEKASQVKRLSLSIPDPEEVPMISDLPRKRKRVQTPNKEQVEIIPDHQQVIKTPLKFEYQVKTIDSPNGEIKLKFNRTLKSVTNTPVQRISRRASTQLGISPSELLQLQTKSPSPQKKFKGLDLNKENFVQASLANNRFSPLSSSSIHNLTTSPILNLPHMTSGGRRQSKDSPSRKRRRVSKKLYD